jgi:small conductance mechanosensitive channel
MNKTTSNSAITNLTTKVSLVIYTILIGLIIMSIFNLNGAVNKFLATAGVLGLAVGLALQDPLTNLFSGVLMSVKDLYKIGDVVESNGFFGTIENITLRNTIIRTFNGQCVTIPNKDVIQNPLTNYYATGKRRLDLECGVSYGDDLNKVKKVALASVADLEKLDDGMAPKFYYTGFGDSSINFILHLWMPYTGDTNYLEVRSNAIMNLKSAFDEANIDIPFPIRTLNFGIKGGRSLHTELQADALANSN